MPDRLTAHNDQKIQPTEDALRDLYAQVRALTARVTQLEQDAQAEKLPGFPNPGWFDEKHRDDPVLHRITGPVT